MFVTILAHNEEFKLIFSYHQVQEPLVAVTMTGLSQKIKKKIKKLKLKNDLRKECAYHGKSRRRVTFGRRLPKTTYFNIEFQNTKVARIG